MENLRAAPSCYVSLPASGGLDVSLVRGACTQTLDGLHHLTIPIPQGDDDGGILIP
jgi:hypothetical protein